MNKYYEVRIEFREVIREDDGEFVSAKEMNIHNDSLVFEHTDLNMAYKFIDAVQKLRKFLNI